MLYSISTPCTLVIGIKAFCTSNQRCLKTIPPWPDPHSRIKLYEQERNPATKWCPMWGQGRHNTGEEDRNGRTWWTDTSWSRIYGVESSWIYQAVKAEHGQGSLSPCYIISRKKSNSTLIPLSRTSFPGSQESYKTLEILSVGNTHCQKKRLSVLARTIGL